MSKRKVAKCQFCGEVTATTREHVIPKSLYPRSVRATWRPIIVDACAGCNNGSSDDDAHLRNVLMLAGDSNAAVMELWEGPVRRGLAQVDGHRRALDVFNLMKPVPELPDNRYMIYPAHDERVLKSIRKITRGLCSHHGLPTPVPDGWVRSDVLRYDVPADLLAQLEMRHAVPEVFSYRFASLKDPDRSVWMFEFFERTKFISIVEPPETPIIESET